METRFCVDCKWHKPNPVGADYGECQHPENTQPDLVTGGTRPRATYCQLMRQAGLPCGVDAAWFAAKEGA